MTRPIARRSGSVTDPVREVSDASWQRIEPILQAFWPGKPTGRRVANWRNTLNAILFRMQSGCRWDYLPERFGPKSTIHGWFQRWLEGGVLEQVWAIITTDSPELAGLLWPSRDDTKPRTGCAFSSSPESETTDYSHAGSIRALG